MIDDILRSTASRSVRACHLRLGSRVATDDIRQHRFDRALNCNWSDLMCKLWFLFVASQARSVDRAAADNLRRHMTAKRDHK